MGGARIEVEVPEGMFVFSKFVEKAAELNSWVKWFATKAIKTQVLWCEQGFYLCREGEEAI
jgi:hypothetical protein